jgi:hypothetical protein
MCVLCVQGREGEFVVPDIRSPLLSSGTAVLGQDLDYMDKPRLLIEAQASTRYDCLFNRCSLAFCGQLRVIFKRIEIQCCG